MNNRIIYQNDNGGIPSIDNATPQIFTTYFRIYNDRYGVGPYDAGYIGANVVR